MIAARVRWWKRERGGREEKDETEKENEDAQRRGGFVGGGIGTED